MAGRQRCVPHVSTGRRRPSGRNDMQVRHGPTSRKATPADRRRRTLLLPGGAAASGSAGRGGAADGWPAPARAWRAGRAGPRRAHGPGRARCPARSPRPARPAPAARCASAVAWHSSSLRDPPPTTWTTSTGSPVRRTRSATASRWARARLSSTARTTAAGVPGTGPPRSRHELDHAGGHVAGREQTRVVDVEGAPPGLGRGRGEQAGEVVVVAGLGPGPLRLLQQPQPHDVAQVADGAVDAELVGEPGRAARLVQARRGQLRADQRPGPGRDVGEAALPRRADDGRGGVVGAHGDDGHGPGEPGGLQHVGAQPAEHLPGLAQRRQQRAGPGPAARRGPCTSAGWSRRRAAWWRRW